MPRTIVARVLAGAVLAPSVTIAIAQGYPSRPLRIVTTEAGGSLDFASRVIAPTLANKLGQPVIVENRGGAGGSLAIETVAKATADGHTMLLYGSAFWILPALRSKLPWHPLRDFAPITIALASPHVLLVHASVNAKSVKELIDLAKARPDELAYASAGTGSTAHIATELLKGMAGIKLLHVPHKSGGPALNSLLGGHEHMMIPPAGASVMSHVKTGRVRALALTSAQPSPLWPELPTVAASGVPGYEADTKIGIYLPARTPVAIVERLHKEIVAIVTSAEAKVRYEQAAMDVVASMPDQARQISQAEFNKMARVVKEAGIRGE